MRDPHPENIDGKKVQRHSFEHHIHWGYLVLGLAIIVGVLKLAPALAEGNDDEDGDTHG